MEKQQIDSHLSVRATAELQIALAKELNNEDKPLKDILNEATVWNSGESLPGNG